MKIRNGFVSNSSSSSFTCDICKETVEVYDGGDSDFLTCEDGHCVCASHVKHITPSTQQMKEFLIKDITDNYSKDEQVKELDMLEGFTKDEVEESYNDVTGGELPSASCPLCQFTTITDDNLMDYLLMLVGSTKKAMIAGALENYPNYDAFCDALKNHKKEMKKQGKK